MVNYPLQLLLLKMKTSRKNITPMKMIVFLASVKIILHDDEKYIFIQKKKNSGGVLACKRVLNDGNLHFILD